jgi:hypothetical protein
VQYLSNKIGPALNLQEHHHQNQEKQIPQSAKIGRLPNSIELPATSSASLADETNSPV